MRMFFGIYMIMVFDPQILFNDGYYDLIDVRIPDGSLLKPKFPAALSGRTHALGRLFDILGGLLGQKTPEFLNAAGFSSSPHLFYSGRDQAGRWFQLFQIGFGGIPGRPKGDGPDGHSLWPNFTNVPNEFLERYFPLRIERYDTVADSGGVGLHRGGNGIHMSYRFLEPGLIAIHDDRWFIPPWGVNGGAPGARARVICGREPAPRREPPHDPRQQNRGEREAQHDMDRPQPRVERPVGKPISGLPEDPEDHDQTGGRPMQQDRRSIVDGGRCGERLGHGVILESEAETWRAAMKSARFRQPDGAGLGGPLRVRRRVNRPAAAAGPPARGGLSATRRGRRRGSPSSAGSRRRRSANARGAAGAAHS